MSRTGPATTSASSNSFMTSSQVRCLNQSAMISSSATSLAQRLLLSTKRGSSIRFGMPIAAAKSLEGALRARRDADPAAVARLVGVARRILGEPVALALLHDAELVEADDLRLDQPEQRLIEADVDLLAAAAIVVAIVDREHRRHGGEGGSDGIGHREARQGRRPVGKAGEGRNAGEGLGDRAVAAALGVWAALAEAGDPHHDEARIDLGELLVAETPALEGAGPIVLDHDVGGLHEFAEQLLAARLRQGERDEPLVARDHLPPERPAVLHRRPVAHRIADARQLDLDHLRAEIGELGRGERACDHRAGIDHAKPLQRTLQAARWAPLMQVWHARSLSLSFVLAWNCGEESGLDDALELMAFPEALQERLQARRLRDRRRALQAVPARGSRRRP